MIIGNPPWVRLHNIPSDARSALRSRFAVYRDAAWEPGARAARASRGFSAQVDLSALFVERSLELARPQGCVALLLPAKLWRSLSGGGVRRLLSEGARLRAVEDWSDAPSSFDAAVYPSVIIASRKRAEEQVSRSLRSSRDDTGMIAGVRRRSVEVEWEDEPASIRLLRDDPASPWLLLPPDVRTAFDRIGAHGTPLGESTMGRATLGVKCGCNDAFMVDFVNEATDVINVEHRGRSGTIERHLLRPLLRGDAVAAWSIPNSRSAIVWTHASQGGPLSALPIGAAKWLAPWRRQLLGRSDLRGSATWWTLFRTEGADHTRTRVVWSDFGRVPRAAILPVGDQTVPLNSCYVVSCEDVHDAHALTALLNGPLAAAWLNAIAG